jgi:hypothetical protein
MPTLAPAMLRRLDSFAPHCSRRVWCHVLVLVAGAILAPGRRTVTAALRAMGLDQQPRVERYHRVLNRARWSGLDVSRTLLRLLIVTFVPDGPLVIGIDETIERRRGAKIAAKGIDRDPVRSSHSHFVKASGLRWVCLMLLVPIPWAARRWALPFLSALAPSERYNREHGRRHKALTDWARQLLGWSGAGGPTAPGSRSRTAPTPRWSSLPPAGPGRGQSPSSRACGSMPPSTHRHPHGPPASAGGHVSRGSACRRWPPSPPIRSRSGRRSPCHTGMARARGPSRSRRTPRSGSTPACHRCRCAGS